MLRKNTSGQVLTFCLVNASTGDALTGATVTAYHCIDGSAQAAATGGVTELANGQYKFAASQADTNGDLIGYLFTATGAVPVNLHVRTTAADLSDGVRLGLTALPNAAAAASGGLLISGSNSGTTTLGALTVSGATTLTGNVAMAAGLTITQSTTNGAGVSITGNGTGPGLVATGGATGSGIRGIGGASEGAGAVFAAAAGNNYGLLAVGAGSGAAVGAAGGATGPGITVAGGFSSGAGIVVTTTSGDGVAVAPTGGHALVLTANGTSKHGAVVTGGTAGTSDGFKCVAGSGGVDIRGTLSAVTTLTNLPSAPTDWLTAAAVKADAVTKIQAGLSTYDGSDTAGTTTLLGRLTDSRAGYLDNLSGGAVALASGVTVTTNNDKTGYSISGSKTTLDALNDAAASAVSAAVWAEATRTLTAGAAPSASDVAAAVWGAGTRTLTSLAGLTVDTVTNLTNNNDKSGYALLSAPPSAADVADAVWDEALSGHATGGSAGAAVSAAGAAGDPWGASLPGAYSAGTAGHILGTYVDAAVTSRQATFTAATGVAFPTNFAALAVDGSGKVLLQATQTGVTIPTVTAVTNQVTANVTSWRGTTPGNVDSNGFVPSNLAAVNGNTGRAVTLATALDGDYLATTNTNAAAVKTVTDALSPRLPGSGTISTHAAADVWAVGTRTLTAGTNIVLAKGTGVTGFNDLSAADVNAEVDTALADVGLTTTVTGRIDAAVSSRSTYAGADTAGTTTLLGRVPGALTISGGAVNANVTSWRGTTPGNVDSNGFVPANLAAVNGNTGRAGTFATALDFDYLANLSGGPVALAGSAPSWYVAPVDVSADVTAVKVVTDALSPRLPGSGTISTHAAVDVWAVGTRTLTAGTNIVLAKGTGVTGFNDLSAAQVNAEVDTALADVGLTTTITGRIDAAVSTRLASASYTTPPTVGAVADAVWDELLADHTTVGSAGAGLTSAAAGGSSLTAEDVWTYSDRELTQAIDVTISPEDLAAALEAVIVASGITSGRVKDPDGNPVTTINLKQAIALLLAATVGDRSGIGTRQIIARIPGDETAVQADRMSRSLIESTVTVAE